MLTDTVAKKLALVQSECQSTGALPCENEEVTHDEVRHVLNHETLQLIDRLEQEDAVANLVRTVSLLRAEGHPAERVHHALEQVRLRRKATSKLGPFAHSMLFTEEGLQQATRLDVAAHHAGRFRDAGLTRVADLGCGLGVDALALSAVDRQVIAVERDPATAALATFNLASFPNTSVVCADATSFALDDVDAVWLDPARREGVKRLSDPAHWSPSLTDTFSILRRIPGGAKLAPGIDRDLLPADMEWQWVSAHGDVVEVVVWSGALRRPGIGRSALVLTPEGAHEMVAESDSPDQAPGDIGKYVYEPDGAVIRARLIGNLARELDGHMIDPQIAYITSDTLKQTAFADAFAVHEVVALKEDVLKKIVRERRVGDLEIKVRGVDRDPATLRKALKPQGTEKLTLLLTRRGTSAIAIVASRIETAPA